MTPEAFNEGLAKFKAESDGRFALRDSDCLPRLADDTASHADYCPIYLYHTGWAARVLAESKPKQHTDFGGFLYFISIASAIVPIRFYDIRPVPIPLDGVTTGSADLTKLPFEDESIESLSCLHVMEHVGLGRYGDVLDVQGDLKAAAELKRVVAKGGQLLIVLPIGVEAKIVFNAHRIYTYEQVIKMFSGLRLKEFSLAFPPDFIRNADPARSKKAEEVAGCFWFVND
jgi:hypothetical protein